MIDEEARQQMYSVALTDPKSAVYKNLVKTLREADACEKRARDNANYVVVPFFVESLDIPQLESQFDIKISIRGKKWRMATTPRVAAFVFLLDAALMQHASSGGRTTLTIDGDIVTMAALGLDGRIVERSDATSRLKSSYIMEEEQLRMLKGGNNQNITAAANVIKGQIRAGGGEQYWPSIRLNGPKVDSLIVNHFKTPVGPSQVAWLAHNRGAVAYGSIVFQHSMLTHDSGELLCFPGKYYIDRDADLITMVPRDDASMCISQPYTAWYDLIHSNVVVVDSKEYICEKYDSLTGVLFYTMHPVGDDFEAPEMLRSHYFDKSSLGVVEYSFPEIKVSDEGVPIGYKRGTARIASERNDKIIARLMTNNDPIIHPSVVMTALMDYNNTVFNSLDSVRIPDRMEFDDERRLAVAIALHVNWRKHAARGTLKVLLRETKKRFGVADVAVWKFAYIALATWWSRPKVMDDMEIDQIPTQRVMDWCGNDFSVIAKDVDPWMEVAQLSGVGVSVKSRNYPWFPCPPRRSTYKDIVDRARKFMSDVGGLAKVAESVVNATKRCGAAPALLRPSNATVFVCVDEANATPAPAVIELTDLKSQLKKKLVDDQAAVNEVPATIEHFVRGQNMSNSLPIIPPIQVEPISAITSDLDMCGIKDPIAGPSVGYRLAEADIDKTTNGTISINTSKKDIPKPRWARLPKISAGSEGSRVSCQTTLLGAAFKRNLGVPNSRGNVDLEVLPKMTVDKIIDVCYRHDWQSIVEKHLNTGMWQPNDPDIDYFLHNMDEKKTQKLLNEFFVEGSIDLDRWMLMAKSKVKPSRELGENDKVDHPQTILFLQEGSTNAMYSSMVRRFKKCVDECLRPEVSLNAQRSDQEHEDWYNSIQSLRDTFQRTYSYEVDIKCFDRSQEHVALRVDLEFYKRHGLNARTFAIWEKEMGLKRAIAVMFGVILNLVLSGISGDWKTLARNGIVNLGAIVMSTRVSRKDIVTIDIKGDDADLEFSRPIPVETTVDNMSLIYNFSSKFNTAHVRYMCKSFRLFVHGRWYFVADPWARVQSVLTPAWIGNHEDTFSERWVSIGADLRHYDNGVLVDKVAEAAQQFYGTERPLYGMSRALARIKNDFNVYINLFGAPQKID